MAEAGRSPRQDLRIFISYRRDDTPGYAGRVYDSLVAHLGEGRVFMDIDTIRPGSDFTEVLDAALDESDVLLALIGPTWLIRTDQQARRRLDNPDDFVRRELEAALRREIIVIPLLVQNTDMPRREELPNSLTGFATRQAFEISDRRWRRDIYALFEELDRLAQDKHQKPEPQVSVTGADCAASSSVDDAETETGRSAPMTAKAATDPIVALDLTHDDTVTVVAFSPDGTRIATGSQDCTVRMWDSTTGLEQFRLSTFDLSVGTVVFSPDGALLATTEPRRGVRFWNSTTGRELDECSIHDVVGIRRLAFSPDGRRLATASYNEVQVRDSTTDRILTRFLTPKKKHVAALAFSPDSARLAVASAKTAGVWDAATGEELVQTMPHGGLLAVLTAVAFTPDGTQLATTSMDKTARLWNSTTGQELARLTHTAAVKSIAINSDGTRLATACGEQAWIWHPETGRLLGQLRHQRAACCIAYNHDGTLLAVGGAPGTVRVWARP
jgi:WD40 repeat protein